MMFHQSVVLLRNRIQIPWRPACFWNGCQLSWIFLELRIKIPKTKFIVNSKSSQSFVNSSHVRIVGFKPWNDYNLNTWSAGQKVKFHSHPYFQAIQVLDGQLEVDYGDGWKMIEHGGVHVLPPGCNHRLNTNTGHRQFGLNFTVQADRMGLLTTVHRMFPVPTIQCMYFLASWGEKLIENIALVSSARLRLLNVLEDWTICLIETKEKNCSDPEAMRLAKMLEIWKRRSINVADVAKGINCSRAKAQRICNRRFGCGIMQLHEKMRMEEASRLLLNSGMSVGEIADQCGYTDIYIFSRAFTRNVGVPPSVFKQRIKNG